MSYLLPAAVEMPAPVITTTRVALPDLMKSATAARLRSDSVRDGVSSVISELCSCPIFLALLRLPLGFFGFECRCFP